MTSNIETIYDILTAWATKFEFIQTVTVGFDVESGAIMICISCGDDLRLHHTISKFEMENLDGTLFNYLENKIFEKFEREFKIATVGEE